MVVVLNAAGYTRARDLVNSGECIVDERDDWSEHQPSAAQENDFIREHGFREYGRWHLGIDDEMREETKGRYRFPFGDLARVHRCAVMAAEARAGQRKYLDIEMAAAHLHGMLDALKR